MMDEHELVCLCWFACRDSLMFQVKSRMMGDSSYKNTFECFIKTLKSEVYYFIYLFYISNLIVSHFVIALLTCLIV